MRVSLQIEADGQGDGNPEAGFLLLAVVVMAAIVLIGLAVAAPIVAKQLQRDKEEESIHRANQYVRAIQLYYRKNNAYPPSIKALENTNNVRYLRKQYIDPLTGKADWRLIHMGEQKTTIKGFFGKPLAGLPGAGGGVGSAAGMQSNIGGSSTVNATGIMSGFNDATIGDTGATGASGSTGASGATGSTGGSGPDSGMFGDSATGAPIVGVGTSATGPSIVDPNGQSTYETWEFWYDPRIELLKRNVSIFGGGGMGSQSATSFNGNGAMGGSGSTGSTGNTGGFGNFGGSGLGNSSGSSFGNSGGGFGSSGSSSGFGGSSFGNSGSSRSGAPSQNGNQQQ